MHNHFLNSTSTLEWLSCVGMSRHEFLRGHQPLFGQACLLKGWDKPAIVLATADKHPGRVTQAGSHIRLGHGHNSSALSIDQVPRDLQ
jgi:hypothetical protein